MDTSSAKVQTRSGNTFRSKLRRLKLRRLKLRRLEAIVKPGTKFGVVLNQTLSLPAANVR